jgi:TolA-binding protein
VPRALYTLAQIAQQDSTSPPGVADSLLHVIVVRFSESEFAAAARHSLGMPPVERAKDTVEVAYKAAEQLMKQGEYAAALQSFRLIAERDTTSPFAAKAQYAVGWIYENINLEPDSSIANYRRLVRRFPGSPYTSAVQPKLTLADAERHKTTSEMPKDTTTAVLPQGKGLPSDSLKVLPSLKEMLKDSTVDEVPKLRIKKE